VEQHLSDAERLASVDPPDDFMARDARKGQSWEGVIDGPCVGVTDAASFNAEADFPGGRLGNRATHQFEFPRFGDLDSAIGPIHKFSSLQSAVDPLAGKRLRYCPLMDAPEGAVRGRRPRHKG
jgi:hypothetical protein